MKLEIWQAFVVGAVLSWGVYVPVLHEGQTKLGAGKGPSAGSVRAFLRRSYETCALALEARTRARGMSRTRLMALPAGSRDTPRGPGSRFPRAGPCSSA